MRLGLLFALACLMIGSASCARILCLMPMPGPSHNIITSALCKELARRNHSVVAVTAFPEKEVHPNYKQIDVNSVRKSLDQDNKDMNIFNFRDMPKWSMLIFMFTFAAKTGTMFMEHPEVVKLLNSDEKFDLVYTEIFVDEAIIAGFSQRFKAPTVILHAFIASLWGNNLVGNPAPAAYVPDSFTDYDTKMSFLERVSNFVFGLFHEALYKLYYLPSQDSAYRKYFGNDLPPLKEVLKNVSAVLVNHHYSLAYPRPYVPNIIEIGGFHVRDPKSIPKDIKQHLDNAKNGAIFFSLGSNIKASSMPQDRLEVFLDAFEKLSTKYTILWKWDGKELPRKLNNVIISDWYPQSDILAHPNIKLFVTHGGLLSTTEAVVRGVPLVGIPIFAEQPLNMRQAQKSGFARMVDFDAMTAEELYEAILDVADNPKYRDNIKKRSALLKDTPQTAMDRAVWWIEYVLRHKGAAHLRSSVQDLSWCAQYSLDVLGTIALTLLAGLYLIKVIFRAIFCRKKQQVSKEKKKQ